MSQSAHQGLGVGRNDLDGHPLSSDSSGRSSPYTESMAAEDKERIHKMYKRMVLDLKGTIAFSALLSVVSTIGLFMSNEYQGPGSINPNVMHAAATLLDFPDAELPPFSPAAHYTIWPIPRRFFSLAIALISMVFVGLSLQRPEGHPILGDAWHQVILCLYFAALHKLLFDVDFGLFITTSWWIGFLWASWRYVARSRVATRNIRAFLDMM